MSSINFPFCFGYGIIWILEDCTCNARNIAQLKKKRNNLDKTRHIIFPTSSIKTTSEKNLSELIIKSITSI